MWIVDSKEVPETLEELLIPSKTAHVMIDIQNDCLHPDGSCAREGSDISMYPPMPENVVRLVDESRKLGVLQVFVRIETLPESRSDSPAWIRLRRRLSVQYRGQAGGKADHAPIQFGEKGTWGSEIVEELKVLPGDLVVRKHRSSAFFGTDLDMLLRSNGRDRLIFTGVTTEGCVESSVRDAGFLDYFPIVISDGVASDVLELHEASLRVMRAYRADVITLQDCVDALHAAV
ncbi:MAG: cysteine hydrolase [Actinobacteria bacterium]|nr:cysteine hydrolase [Actinomycetota bacterium]